jgi:hypothetical protein
MHSFRYTRAPPRSCQCRLALSFTTCISCVLPRLLLPLGARRTHTLSHRLAPSSKDRPAVRPPPHCKRPPSARSPRIMASSAARLARLHNFVQSDLDALPHRPLPEPEALSDDDTSGGVALDPPSKQPAPSPVADSASAQTLPITPNTPQKSISDEDTERRFVWKQGAVNSYNLGSQPKLSALPAIKLVQTDLKKGELAQQKYFTPITALAKYPYQFCNKSCMQDIASGFFDAGKFWAREWDL